MNLMSLLSGWSVPAVTEEIRVRKYSTTGDILAFKRCRRQYGYFGVRGFSSATATQRYFGTLVHDVLDRINRDYRLCPRLPNSERVREMVDEAHERLIRSGVRPYNSTLQREQATKLISRFVMLIGPHFFPHVTQTEYRLERALRTPAGSDYVLHGVVDVLSGAVSHALELRSGTRPEDVEIWDYKSGHMPQKSSLELCTYEYQMRVYAELYRQQTGAYLARCAIVFVGELGDDARWDAANLDFRRFPDLVHTLHPDPGHIATAMRDFHEAVEAIETERLKPYSQQWQAPDHPVDKPTCEACELRYNCRAFPTGAAQRREAL
jgi:DNA helicase-2/ATP-dependent DNA helicase PcrA